MQSAAAICHIRHSPRVPCCLSSVLRPETKKALPAAEPFAARPAALLLSTLRVLLKLLRQ
ncbi:hypothetical protein CAter282_3985 [Collimonas arenae]|uniref:Uncharacterized protein n=1 Tax=Collimonas arenae TaxID=279058 RepID=A0A127QNM8_9BURK|nr:hypothetical protein CAter282_3985 [Collimonas arenae]